MITCLLYTSSDPGKVGINEVLEKDINLKISKQVEKELKNKGYQVVMTREKDQMLAGETSGNSKIQDMKARVDLINEKAPGLAVSIHQNSYHEEEIHGAQVFYYSHSAEGHTAVSYTHLRRDRRRDARYRKTVRRDRRRDVRYRKTVRRDRRRDVRYQKTVRRDRRRDVRYQKMVRRDLRRDRRRQKRSLRIRKSRRHGRQQEKRRQNASEKDV